MACCAHTIPKPTAAEDTPPKSRSLWGWGWRDPPELVGVLVPLVLAKIEIRFNVDLKEVAPEIQLSDIHLNAPRFELPGEDDSKWGGLRAMTANSNAEERVLHSYGKAFVDIVRALQGKFDHAPDYVAFPRSEEDLRLLLAFASERRIAVIAFGGGTSVVRGVEPVGLSGPDRRCFPFAGVVSCDLRHFNRLLDVNTDDRTGTLQAGMSGPLAEEALRPYGLSTRHYAQSFEFATVGGWAATRGQGHLATMYVHVDELVEGLRVVTPRGVVCTPQFPGFGSGPDSNRLFVGSEGALGIITQVKLKLHRRPAYRVAATVPFTDFWQGVAAARAVAQSGVYPQNCRLVDANEAETTGMGDGECAYLILAIEGEYPAVEAMRHLLGLCRKHGGRVGADEFRTQRLDNDDDKEEKAEKEGGGRKLSSEVKSDVWRQSFVLSPYLRNELVRRFVISETFETACSWSQFPGLYREVTGAVCDAIERVCGPGQGSITCRFTAVYPSGPAPYFTVLAVGRRSLDAMIEQWEAIKLAASDALLRAGGCITHHHAVGRYHRAHYAREADPLYLQVLQRAKDFLDPQGILNPGVLLDIQPTAKL